MALLTAFVLCFYSLTYPPSHYKRAPNAATVVKQNIVEKWILSTTITSPSIFEAVLNFRRVVGSAVDPHCFKVSWLDWEYRGHHDFSHPELCDALFDL